VEGIMIKNMEICPNFGRIADYSSYFNKHCCTNTKCNFHELIVHKNEDWIEPLCNRVCGSLDQFTRMPNEYEIMAKVNKIIETLNKITNPDVKDGNIIK
jgi:hypothetical protein